MRRTRKNRHRRGTVLVLAAFLMIFLMIILAFAVDFGYWLMARTELQRTADAAALSATWELIDEGVLGNDPYMTAAIADARSEAVDYGLKNKVCREVPSIEYNTANEVEGDIVIGYLANLSDPNASFDFSDSSRFNAVTVRVRRTAEKNGLVPGFFSRVMGIEGNAMQAEATAALQTQIGGFRIVTSGGKLGMLPFALDEETWDELLAGNADDDWAWDAAAGEVKPWSDGIREVNLYPQGTGAPGNRGTVDIGGHNNSTNDIARQIVEGANEEDLEHLGGSVELDENGELFLNGDTGISAGVKDELLSIKGEPRIIPIFREVNGPGNNAMYTIVKFAGVRIMEVKLTGKMSGKRVIIQPAPMVTQGVIPSPSGETSYLIFSPAYLIR